MQTSCTLRIAPERSTIEVRRRRFSLAALDAVLAQRAVDRRQREVRVEPRPLALERGAVREHQQLGAVEHLLRGLVLQALERALGRLGLEAGDVEHRRAPAEALPQVLEQVGLVLLGDAAIRLVGERRHVVVPAEDDRERGLDRARLVLGPVDRRARAEHGPAGEVLDLALAVDRRVGHDRDRLLEVVGQVLALRRQRGQRAVVAERADRLGAVGGHLLHELGVLALPAHAGQHALLDLDGLGRPGRVVARDLGALERAAGGDRLLEAGDRSAPVRSSQRLWTSRCISWWS